MRTWFQYTCIKELFLTTRSFVSEANRSGSQETWLRILVSCYIMRTCEHGDALRDEQDEFEGRCYALVIQSEVMFWNLVWPISFNLSRMLITITATPET